ncbi:hypothetical protein IQ276_023090 [Desmonostoc muscorum LEGE 12446]|uniref:hypothetical protein n=1 Tax=Desmonostoc muscorum TaxID=1179 RepID=UPI001F168293|nr:hypothetical protein [Desmonostoc muscorum]MCF2149260.1 hypothetical protein [Desmonostoc muscorum LEGE 12446]
MQVIQPLLGNNIHPLGVISSLSNTHRLVLRKESDFLHSRSNFISPRQTKAPLVTSSQFLLSRDQEPSIQPVIGWDSWDNPDINSGFPFIDFDPFESIDSEENNNFNPTEVIKSDIPERLPTVIENNTINDVSPEIKIQKQSKSKNQTKSKSKQTNKSQQQSKTKTKSSTKKSVKSSAAKNVIQAAEKSNIPINHNQNSLIPSDEPLSPEVNPSITQINEIDILKSQTSDSLPTWAPLRENNNLALDNPTIDDESISNTTPSITASTSPNVQDQPTLFRNIAKEESQVISELPSSLSRAEPTISKNISPLQQNKKLNDNTSELAENSPREFPVSHNNEEKFSSPSNFNNNQQQVVTEVSEVIPTPPQQDIQTSQSSSQKVDIPDISVSPKPLQQYIETSQSSQKVDIPDISVSPTPLQQDIKTSQSSSQKIDIPDISVSPTPLQQDIEPDEFTSQVENQSTPSLRNVIQKKEILPIPNSPSPEQESLNTNNTIEPDLISENTTSNFHTDNFVADSSLKNAPLSSAITENPVETHSGATLEPILVPKDPIESQQEIDSSVRSKSLASAPVQLTPTSANIEETSSLLQKSSDKEQLVTSESQSTAAVNVSDVRTNLISLQRDNNLENTISESTENQPILAPPEIVEAAKVSNISPEIVESPVVNATSPEIVEAAKVSNISPEIVESKISSEIVETAKVSNISPEIVESPVVNATSPEIVQAAKVSNISPEIVESKISSEIVETAKVSNISPEIVESPVVNATSPEIVQASKISNISPEIVESPVVNATSPEIIEAPKVSNISPEIIEAAKVSDVSSNVGETSNIFPKIAENEQIVESELLGAIANSSEISTFVDTSDLQDISEKPAFLQNQVSTPPEVEQNTTIQNLPAPKGYATGGQVTDSQIQNKQQIAPSDTVPAMLTPGEFVINTRDAQKNLPLLQHINTGGTPDDIILPSLQPPNTKEPEKTTSGQSSTKVDSFPDTSLQLKPQESNSLIPASLGLNVGKQKLSVLNSPQLSTVENKTSDAVVTSPQYSSPPLIFRKANSTANTPSQRSDTPSQWSSVQELFNGNNDEFTSLFSGGQSNNQNSEFSDISTSSESSQIFAKHLPAPRGFADGGEVTAPTSENTESITETVQSSSAKQEEDNKDDTAELEALAREIYSRLRQRLEIERERHGGYSGRLSW